MGRILPFFSFVFPRVPLDEYARQGPAREGLAVRATALTSAAPWPRLVREQRDVPGGSRHGNARPMGVHHFLTCSLRYPAPHNTWARVVSTNNEAVKTKRMTTVRHGRWVRPCVCSKGGHIGCAKIAATQNERVHNTIENRFVGCFWQPIPVLSPHTQAKLSLKTKGRCAMCQGCCLSVGACFLLTPSAPTPHPIRCAYVFCPFAHQRSCLVCPPPRIFQNMHHELICVMSLPGEANFIPDFNAGQLAKLAPAGRKTVMPIPRGRHLGDHGDRLRRTRVC